MVISSFTYACLYILAALFVGIYLILCFVQKNRIELRPYLIELTLSVYAMQIVCVLREWAEVQLTNLIAIQVLTGLDILVAFVTLVFLHKYLLMYSREYNHVKLPHWFDLVIWPIGGIVAFLAVIGYATGTVFYFSPAGILCRGDWYFLLQVALLVLPILDVYLVATEIPNNENEITAAWLLFLLVPIATRIIDLFARTEFFPLSIALSLVIVFAILDQEANTHSLRQQQLIAKQQEELALNEVALSKSRTKTMISQLRPHFLFNALSVIMYYCKKNPDVATKAIADFSSYLRANIESLQITETIPFKKEHDQIAAYMRIEQLRFREKLRYEEDLKVMDFSVPALSIQPLLENSVKHGVSSKREGGSILLKTYNEGDFVVVEIVDDGLGFNPDEVKSGEDNARGIESIRHRLETMSNASLYIESKPGEGTRILVSIPRN